MKITVIAFALALSGLALDAHAQNPGGTTTPGNTPGSTPGGGFGRGRTGQRRPPSPETIAVELMQKFDADKDGELSQTELTQALEALREHRHRGPGGSPSQGGQTGGPSGQGDSGVQGAQSGGQARPSPEKVAAHMIEKFSSDKKGLTVAELAKAIAEHRANQGQHGSQQPGA